jgi:hypothetical protein
MTWWGRARQALLGHGTASDPNEMLELLTVPIASSQLLLHGLADRSIPATGQPTYNLVTQTLSDCRITVRRRDLSAALGAVRDLGFSD